MEKPSIFICSSNEALYLADAVFAELESAYEPTVWDQGFEPSTLVLEGLEGIIKKYDYSVLILSPDDELISRGAISPVARDNLIFELGLFIGAIGRKRVFLITPHNHHIKLPTDLLGIITLNYTIRDDKKYRSAVRSACTQIKEHILCNDIGRSKLDPRSIWPLKVSIITQDEDSAKRLASALSIYNEVIKTTISNSVFDARASMMRGEVDGVFIDIFSIGVNEGIDLIAYARDRHRDIGFCLYGTFQELYELPGVKGMWRYTFQHFWRMPKDGNNESFNITAEDIIIFLFIYKLSRGVFGEGPGKIVNSIMRREVAGSWDVWDRIIK